MKNPLLFCFLCIFCPLAAQAQKGSASTDSDSFTERIMKISDRSLNLRGRLWDNPLMAFYRYGDMDIHTMEGRAWKEDLGRSGLAQTGNDDRAFRLNAGSRYSFTPNDGLMGSVEFEKGRTKGISWNAGGDFTLLYPYVIGLPDTSFIDRERYSFMGAYLHKFGRWSAGGQFKYRAELTSRDRDPRPQNIVGDLDAKLFGGWAGDKYRLAVTASYRHYTQTSKVRWLGNVELNRVPYHMSGIGYHFHRDFIFHDEYANFVGDGYGCSLEFAPTDGDGLGISAGYNLFSFDRELPLSNDMPITSMDVSRYWTEVSWIHKGRFVYGLRLLGELEDRKGIERTINDGKDTPTSRFEVGEEFDGIQIKDIRAAAELHWGRERDRGLLRRYAIMPSAAYHSYKPDYEYNESSLEIVNLDARLGAEALMCLKDAWWMNVNLHGGYTSNLDAINKMGYPQLGFEAAFQTTEDNFKRLTDAYVAYGGGVRVDHRLNNGWGVYLDAEYEGRSYDAYGSTYRVTVSIGATF